MTLVTLNAIPPAAMRTSRDTISRATVLSQMVSSDITEPRDDECRPSGDGACEYALMDSLQTSPQPLDIFSDTPQLHVRPDTELHSHRDKSTELPTDTPHRESRSDPLGSVDWGE